MDDEPLGGIASTLVQLSVASDPALGDTLAAPARSESPAPPAPKREQRYQPRGLLGEGGMGRVERVWDRDLRREIAVKELRPELRAQGELLEQFLWEARIAAHLDHPNIVPVHDLGVTPTGHLFFTMKLVRGRPLDTVLARVAGGEEELPLKHRLRIFLQVCNAISFAHSRGVLHRDLKPANLMLGEHGEVLVTDWGLALPLGERDDLAELVPAKLRQAPSGTPAYMSPERVRGDAFDERSDVYALGAILYELVALRPAFEASTVPALLLKVTAGDHAPLREACPESPPSLNAVVAKAMAFRAEDRYATIQELSVDVEAVIDGGTPSAEQASLLRQATRFYLGHDPAMDGLRVVDIDLWAFAGWTVGVGVGVLLAPWLGHWWWALWIAGFAAGAPPTVRWLRLRRARSQQRRDGSA